MIDAIAQLLGIVLGAAVALIIYRILIRPKPKNN